MGSVSTEIIKKPITKSQGKRRSRFGCRNCKLRKLKCDESKPHCKRCTAYGVTCNFSTLVGDLQPLNVTAISQIDTRSQSSSLSPPPSNAIWTSDSSEYYFLLDGRCRNFITRYLGRSLVKPSDPILEELNARLLALTFEHPFLMHACLATAFAYDRFLNHELSTPRRRSALVQECYHRSQSAMLFRKRLQDPIKPYERDPIWGTAAALAVLAFSAPAGTWLTREKPWPLAASASDASDDDGYSSQSTEKSQDDAAGELLWLQAKDGKMSLWSVTNPLRPDSIFHIMSPVYDQMYVPLADIGIDGIPPALVALCQLNPLSSDHTSPYFTPAHALSHLFTIPDEDVTIGHTEVFMLRVQGPFKEALIMKDPIALLLLYLWYRKAGRCIWWVELRGRVEAPAIRSYLKRYHRFNRALLEFLPGGRFGDEASFLAW